MDGGIHWSVFVQIVCLQPCQRMAPALTPTYFKKPVCSCSTQFQLTRYVAYNHGMICRMYHTLSIIAPPVAAVAQLLDHLLQLAVRARRIDDDRQVRIRTRPPRTIPTPAPTSAPGSETPRPCPPTKPHAPMSATRSQSCLQHGVQVCNGGV